MNNNQKNREGFNKAISYIKREGIEDLVKWLETTDFFTAPASSVFHSNFEGGLLEHSLYVLEFALNSYNWIVKKKPEYEYLKESVIICALFHDVSKINMYHIEQKWTKNSENKWISYNGYVVKDDFPLGHAEKSIILVNKYIELKNEEMIAMRWHHGAFEVGTTIPGQIQYAYNQAYSHPLVKIISTADVLATSLENVVDYKSQATI